MWLNSTTVISLKLGPPIQSFLFKDTVTMLNTNCTYIHWLNWYLLLGLLLLRFLCSTSWVYFIQIHVSLSTCLQTMGYTYPYLNILIFVYSTLIPKFNPLVSPYNMAKPTNKSTTKWQPSCSLPRSGGGCQMRLD